MSDIAPATPIMPPAEILSQLFASLRTTPPRLIQSPPTQPRRASVALIIRMRPAEGLVFEGREPEGYTGQVIETADFGIGLGLDDFLRVPWVNHPLTVPELLFIRRAKSSVPNGQHNRWSSHIAFPGGRQEPEDESASYTALRETWEEIGIDLAEKEFIQVGRLDEREVTTSLGKRLMMILSPFVFLQTTPFTPTVDLNAAEVSSLHWIPLPTLTPPFSPEQWSHIDIDISTRLSPRNKFIRWSLRQLVGKMQFGCLLLPDEPSDLAEGFDAVAEVKDLENLPEGSGSWYNKAEGKRMLRLWGLTLGMTLDLVAHLPTASPSPLIVSASKGRSRSSSQSGSNPLPKYDPRTPVTVTSSYDDHWGGAAKMLADEKPAATPKDESMVGVKGFRGRRRYGVGPGVTAVFPRFEYPDVNFWIWSVVSSLLPMIELRFRVFGRRYRQVVRRWEASVRGQVRPADKRMNWSGAALATFYTAVRQALVVAILLRALATGLGIAAIGWWVMRRWGVGGEL
ncbi:hypothetical protein M231_03627 [Tremella mesenterica]|uniref:Nudix hydrolase domain-containing protein n=1 Tax=Tremella mesenterica TaxID=5217 RepID=A0A4Q1BN60_TREME|nr:hypothetical protein M231_03627 [Tremella mesenterica]